MDRLVAIGDIHGCVHTLKDLLNRVSYSSQTDTLVFIGDYIDRGYFSYEVVDMLIKLQHQVGKDKVVCLRGNHEQMAIDAYRHGNYPLWYRNGGRSTEYSFEKNGQDLANAISWFETLPLVYDTPEIIFCHAGLSYPCCKITARKIFCGDATGFGRIRKSERNRLYLVIRQEAEEEPIRFQLATSVSMPAVYLVVAYVRL